MLTRRGFAGGSIATLALMGLARRGLAHPTGETYANEVEGFGALTRDSRGLFDLPRGFSYSIISEAGKAMDDGFLAPDNFDGMACFPAAGGRVALVRNHELLPRFFDAGPTGGDRARIERLLSLPHFGKDDGGRPLPGGTTTLIYDPVGGRLERQWLSLAGTIVNCAGGATPWGSWLSCEENVAAPPDLPQAHGWVFEVPVDASGPIAPVPLRAMGRFRHEAAAVDPESGIVYLTEDSADGLFYRFLPRSRGRLAAGGRLQALAIEGAAGADIRNWDSVTMAPGSTLAVRWVDLEEVESPADDLRHRGHAAGAAIFARGEGITRAGRDYYFTCTSGGPAKLGQIFRYTPGRRLSEDGRLHLFVESADPRRLDYADNLTVAPWGDLIVCEDRGTGELCHLKGVTPAGQVYAIGRLGWQTELAGIGFSPDGGTMFLNVYRPGRTLAIKGPFQTRSLRAV